MKRLTAISLVIIFLVCASFFGFKTFSKNPSPKACGGIFRFHNYTNTYITNIHFTIRGYTYSGSAGAGQTWTSGDWLACDDVPITVSWTCGASNTYSYLYTFPDNSSSSCRHYTGTSSSVTYIDKKAGFYDFYINTGTQCN